MDFLQDLGYKDKDLLLSFQWAGGFWFGDDLCGRMTRTILIVPYAGPPEYKILGRKILPKFKGFMPAGCEALRCSLPKAFRYQAFAWVDTAIEVLALADTVEQARPSAVGGEQPDVGGQEKAAVGYHFFRWNGNDTAPELEDATTKDGKVKESWDKWLAKTMPPVSFWGQERWDVELAPCYRVEAAEEDDEDEKDEE
jgi:hypothetical protein